jgi:hypothetical protein
MSVVLRRRTSISTLTPRSIKVRKDKQDRAPNPTSSTTSLKRQNHPILQMDANHGREMFKMQQALFHGEREARLHGRQRCGPRSSGRSLQASPSRQISTEEAKKETRKAQLRRLNALPYRKEYHRAKRQRYISEGRCSRCGKENMDSPFLSRCSSCAGEDPARRLARSFGMRA